MCIDSVVICFMVTNRYSDYEVVPKRRAENFVVSSQNRESFVRRNTELQYIVKDAVMQMKGKWYMIAYANESFAFQPRIVF